MVEPDSAGSLQLVGQLLDGRYRIDAVLGHGGMGVVYRATQTSMQRQVAVKTLHPQLAIAPRFFERFKREAEVASRLRHPNIITIYDFGKTAEGVCYLVMELLEGVSLRQRVKDEGPLTLRSAAALVEQVAVGVGHAHRQSVVHRDLKPHNIMLAEVDGHEWVKVLDFGLVKAVEQDQDEALTTTGQVLGTPQYMPPEQASGELVDRRSDLYSLVGVLYFCLTGHSPFGATSVRKALTAALSTTPRPINSVRQGAPVPDAVDRLVVKGLRPEKEDRFQSAEELVAALEAAVAGVPDAVLDAAPLMATDPAGDRGSGSSSSRPRSRSRAPVRTSSAVSPRPMPLRQGTPAPVATAPPPRTRTVVLAGAAALVLAVASGLMLAFGPGPEERPAAAVASPPETAPPTPAVVPAQPITARVVVKTQPPGARVSEDGAVLGATPLTLSFPEGVSRRLTFRMPGYKELTQTLRPEGDRALHELEFIMEPDPVRPSARPAARPAKRPEEPPLEAFE